jgi:hypothetical protein
MLPHDDELAAGVILLGLHSGLLDETRAVSWADFHLHLLRTIDKLSARI